MENLQQPPPQPRPGQVRTSAWFDRGEFYWRSGAAFAWLLLLCPVAVFIYSVLILVDFYHPITWITDCAQLFFDDNAWLYMVILMWLLFPMMIGHARLHSVKLDVKSTRLGIWLSPLVPPYCLYVPVCGVCGAVSMWVCISLLSGPYMFLSMSCSGGTHACLNEHHLFLVLFGGWVGISYGISYFWNTEYLLEFPVIKQQRFFRVKAGLPGCVLKAVSMAFWKATSFYMLYYIFGHFVRQSFLDNGGFELDSAKPSLTSLSGLLDLYLFWVALTSSTLILSLWFLSNTLFNIFNTQVYKFEIEASFSQDKNKTLISSMASADSPLLQYLAFLDLSQLSLFSPRRRKMIFCLSQPGGRPVTWTAVCTECLKVLSKVKEDVLKNVAIREMQYKEQRNGSLSKLASITKQVNGALNQSSNIMSPLSPGPGLLSKSVFNNNAMPATNVSRRTLDHSVVTPGRTNGMFSPQLNSPKVLESHTKSHFDSTLGGRVWNDQQLIPDERKPKRVTIHNRMVKSLKETRILSYLIGELPEASVQQIFQDWQLQLWAADGLSRLVAASLTEDSFGVVQKDLPQILSSMLELYLALDKYTASPLLSIRPSKQRQPNHNLPQQSRDHIVKESIKSALYRIIQAFHPHLGAIHLEPEVKMKLLAFYEYKE